MNTRLLCSGLLISAVFGFARADTVFLTNGTQIDGTVTEDNDNTVSIKKANGRVQSFRRADVDTVVYEVKPAAAPKPETAVEKEKKEDATDEDAKKEEKDKKEDKDKKKEEWTPPPGLPAFPKLAKRMDKAKEEQFMTELENLASNDETVRSAASDAISAMGPDALPYVVAGLHHISVYARTACMRLVGQFGGKSAVKQVIEIFFACMPIEGRAAAFQVQFISAIRDTLPGISGQQFFTAEPKSELMQTTLSDYINWYNTSVDQLQDLLGDPKLDKTDPDYVKKLQEARKLELTKPGWPAPPSATDEVSNDPAKKNNDRPDVGSSDLLRPDDKEKLKLPKVSRGDAYSRNPTPVPDKNSEPTEPQQ